MSKMRMVLPVFGLAIALVVVDSALAQRGRGGGNTWWRGGGTNNMFLLMSEGVQGELELSDSQMADLQALQDEARQSMRDMFSGMRDMSREEREAKMEEIQVQMESRTKELESQVNDILLPHQQTRLKQLGFQSSGRGRGAGGALGNDALLDELGVTSDQKEELEDAIEKAREELQEKYQKLVKEAENDILKVLTSEQRAKYKELVGEPYQFEDRRNRGDRGNERGERGRERGSDF